MKARPVWFILLIVACGGCARLETENFFTRSFDLNQLMFANVGASLISWEEGVREKAQKAAVEKLTHELLYSGLQGRTIFITYREYSGGRSGATFIRPAFSQELKYELGEAGKGQITFREIQIEVDQATSERIRFKVLYGPEDISSVKAQTQETEKEDPMSLYPMEKRRLVQVELSNGYITKAFLVGESSRKFYFSPVREAAGIPASVLKTSLVKMEEIGPE
jgi:hypothetical protein